MSFVECFALGKLSYLINYLNYVEQLSVVCGK